MLNCRKYLVKRQRLSVEVSVLVVARPVVCMCYTILTLIITKQATSPSFHRWKWEMNVFSRNTACYRFLSFKKLKYRKEDPRYSYNPANILYYCLPSIRRCIIFFHRELSYLSWSYVKSKKFKVQAQFLSRVHSNCFKCVQQVPGLSTASRCYHRKLASWTDDFLYWS